MIKIKYQKKRDTWICWKTYPITFLLGTHWDFFLLTLFRQKKKSHWNKEGLCTEISRFWGITPFIFSLASLFMRKRCYTTWRYVEVAQGLVLSFIHVGQVEHHLSWVFSMNRLMNLFVANSRECGNRKVCTVSWSNLVSQIGVHLWNLSRIWSPCGSCKIA